MSGNILIQGPWKEDGTDITPKNLGSDVNIGTGGLKDNDVTTAIEFGDAANTSFDTTNKTVVGAVNENTTAIAVIASGGTFATGKTDPAVDAITVADVDNNIGVVITLTAAGNNQTLPTPTTATNRHVFEVINNDTSTDNINIIGSSTVTLQPGKNVEFTWDGSAWIANDASGLWLDDGTDIKAQNSTRNIDIQAGLLKDNDATGGIALAEATDTTFDTTKKSITGAVNELNTNSVFRSEWLQNGIVDKADSTLAFVNGTRVFTINRTGASFDYYVQGVKYTVSTDDVAGTNTVTLTDTEGLWAIYYDGATLTALNSPSHSQYEDVIMTKCVVGLVYYDATNNVGILYEERHGYQMAPWTHRYLHEVVGLAYTSGLALADFVISDGADNEDAQFSIASGECYDEDLEIDLNTINATTGNIVFYRDGSDWRWTTQTGFKCITFDQTNATRLAYDNAGTLTEVTNNRFALVHVFATNAYDGNAISIIGQAEYLTANLARDGAETEISNLVLGSLPSEEMKPIATVIYQTADAYANDVNARVIQTAAGDNYVDWRTTPLSAGVGAADHGALGGLADDDHDGHPWLLGRSGGQTLIGGTDASDGLTLQSSSNATKGLITLGSTSAYDEVNDRLGIGELAPATSLEVTSTTPYVTLHNSTDEDIEGGRESQLLFKGHQSGAEETTLAKIQASHDGVADDQKGDLIFYTNDGTDADAPTERLRVDSAGLVTVAGLTTAGGIVQTNGTGDISSSVTLPDGTLATSQSAIDNTTKVATTAYVETAKRTVYNTQTSTAYALVLADKNKTVIMANGASNYALTFPDSVFTIGDKGLVWKTGSGEITGTDNGSISFVTVLGDVNWKIDGVSPFLIEWELTDTDEYTIRGNIKAA